MVIISDEAIASPLIKEPTICVAMNGPSLRKYESKVKTKGLIVVNKSITDSEAKRKDIEILNIPITELAKEAGDHRIGNMVALGALLSKRKIIGLESLINGLKDIVSSTYHNLLPVNEKAIRKGFEYGSR
jgi:2-oxoglutarate ferredoxin oxidoreductase subunit gamma